MLPLGWPQAAAFRVLLMVMAVGSLMGTCMEAEQPLASVTVAVCEPALRLVAVLLLWPLLQLKVYGAVPPDALRIALPLFPPLHETFVLLLMLSWSNAGSFSWAFAVVVQLLAFLTVTE